MPDDDKDLDVHELYQLKLLEHVDESPQLNNRKASRILGVSVKLAHELLTRMVAKGLFHITKHHARRWDYFLTPRGLSEKARLTMEFLDFSMHFYRRARRQSAQLCRNLAESGRRRVALLGAGDLAEIVYLGIQEWGLELVAVHDDHGKRRFMRVPVKPLTELTAEDVDAVIVSLYDAGRPTGPSYIPAGVERISKMVWVFDRDDASSPVPPAHGIAAPPAKDGGGGSYPRPTLG